MKKKLYDRKDNVDAYIAGRIPKLTAENSTAIRNTIEMLGSGASAENSRPETIAAATAAVDHTIAIH